MRPLKTVVTIAVVVLLATPGRAATIRGQLGYAGEPLWNTFTAAGFASQSVRVKNTTTSAWSEATLNPTAPSYEVTGLAAGTYQVHVMLSPSSERVAGSTARSLELTGMRSVTVGASDAATLDFQLLYAARVTAPYDSAQSWPGGVATCPKGSPAPHTVTLSWAPVPRATRYIVYLYRRSCASDAVLREDTINTTPPSVTFEQKQVTGEDNLSFGINALNGAVFIGSSSIQVSYSGTYYRPTLYEEEAGRHSHSVGQHLAQVAHVKGSGTAFWMSDLTLTNPTAGPITTVLYFTPRGANGLTGYLEASVDVPAGVSRSFNDIVLSLFGLTSAGTLEVTSSALVVSSRTYTTAAGGATYGQGYLPIRSTHLASLAGPARLWGGGVVKGAFRTNLALNEVWGESATVRVDLHDRTGMNVGHQEVALLPYSTAQINDLVVALAGASTLQEGMVSVTVTAGAGKVAGTLSIVDNASADPATVPLEPR